MWRPMKSLAAGRLAYLHFEDAGSGRLGYVDGLGAGEWPDDIRGLRPDGWCDASDLLHNEAIAGLSPKTATKGLGEMS